MDFVGPFPTSEGGHDFLWVIMCRLTNLVHLVPVNVTVRVRDLAWMYIREVVRLHGLPRSIVSDRDPRFTSRFWQEVHRLLGTRLLMSTSFHPQTDGATERQIRNVNQILRSMVKPDQSDWEDHIALAEFAINSSVSASTGFAPFELTYGYMPTMLGNIQVAGEAAPGVRAFGQAALRNLALAHDAILEHRALQTHYANQTRRPENPFAEGDMVYISTKDISMPKGRAAKLMPKWIGPYRVTKRIEETSNYMIDLPRELKERRIHPMFHVSKL